MSSTHVLKNNVKQQQQQQQQQHSLKQTQKPNQQEQPKTWKQEEAHNDRNSQIDIQRCDSNSKVAPTEENNTKHLHQQQKQRPQEK